ncbi:MAG: VRR-NUC domain-containing protein [Clostridiales bacterium]|jgi:hypothetical protein|nr:VRR-NUC domain-containing protein [Clostridiales bacterium]
MGSEKALERKLREAVKKAGGLAVKLTPVGLTGMPDRLILLPGGRVAFAEIKSAGKKPTALQQTRIAALRVLGFTAAVIDGEERLKGFLEELHVI